MTKISSIQIFLEGGASRSNDDFAGSYRINAHMQGEYEEGKAQLERLIAAAPALLEALEACLGMARSDRAEEIYAENDCKLTEVECAIKAKVESVKMARAALKQAKGE